MALLETGVRNALLAVTAITGLVGTRIRPLAVGKAPFPYLTTKVTDGKTDASLDGSIADYQKAEFEIGIYSGDYDEVANLSELVKGKLDMLGETVSGIEFAPCEYDDQTDIEQATPEGDEMPVYLRVQTYKVLYKVVS